MAARRMALPPSRRPERAPEAWLLLAAPTARVDQPQSALVAEVAEVTPAPARQAPGRTARAAVAPRVLAPVRGTRARVALEVLALVTSSFRRAAATATQAQPPA